MECLRQQYRMPVEFDPLEQTWHYTGATGEIAATLVTVEDRRALLVAMQAVEQFAGTPWYARLKALMPN